MPISPAQHAVRRLGLAVRHGNGEAERVARQDLAAAKIAACISAATDDQPPLRPEQRDALVRQLLAGGAA